MIKIINTGLLDTVSKQAASNSRLRMNYNFHKNLDDPVNRLLNAMEPNSYFPPHRHLNPDIAESLIVLRGGAAVFIFNGDGTVVSTAEISPSAGVYGIEIEAGVWHSLVVLEPQTVIYEVKRGPYIPLTPENTAPWAPPSGNTPAAEAYMEKLLSIHETYRH